jgi:hypothetical protein
VVEGVQFARPGTQVNVRPTRLSAGPPSAAAAAPAAAPPPASQATLAR